MATEHATEPEPVEAPLEQPPPAYKNFVPTLNAQGFMTETLDPVSAEWVAFAASPQCAALGPALDCGAAYGTATLRALRADAADTDAGTAAGTGAGGGGGGEEGARVVANDLDERHLQILWEKADAAARRRLRLLPGRFPEAVHAALSGDAGGEDKEAVSFPMPTLGGVGAVLVCRVLHFFDGDGVRDAIQRIAQWLAPGGKAFLVAETPYLKNMQETFTPEYERRVAAGYDAFEWPGYIDDFATFDAARAGKGLPKSLHLLDPSVLRRECESAGLTVERAAFLDRRGDFPSFLACDGRESVGVVARKPAAGGGAA